MSETPPTIAPQADQYVVSVAVTLTIGGVEYPGNVILETLVPAPSSVLADRAQASVDRWATATFGEVSAVGTWRADSDMSATS